MHLERRHAARRPFFATAEVTAPRWRYVVVARTNELSRAGCYVDMPNPFHAGTELSIRLVHDGEVVELPGRVVHAQPNVGMGVRFACTGAAPLARLDRWLDSTDTGSDG
jgi:hypothetical protein